MVKNDSKFCPMEPGRRERRRTETRTRIFEAAMKLFSERGFSNTPVEEITDAADVAKGTFFNYFPNKEAIFEALAERQLGVIVEAEEKARTAPSVRPVLVEMIHKLAARPSRSQLLLRSLMGAALTNGTMTRFFGKVLENGRRHVANIMQRGQELGEIRSDVPPVELARILQHSIMGTHVIWAISAPSDLDAWIEKTFEIVWSGLAVRDCSSSGPAAAENRSTS